MRTILLWACKVRSAENVRRALSIRLAPPRSARPSHPSLGMYSISVFRLRVLTVLYNNVLASPWPMFTDLFGWLSAVGLRNSHFYISLGTDVMVCIWKSRRFVPTYLIEPETLKHIETHPLLGRRSELCGRGVVHAELSKQARSTTTTCQYLLHTARKRRKCIRCGTEIRMATGGYLYLEQLPTLVVGSSRYLKRRYLQRGFQKRERYLIIIMQWRWSRGCEASYARERRCTLQVLRGGQKRACLLIEIGSTPSLSIIQLLAVPYTAQWGRASLLPTPHRGSNLSTSLQLADVRFLSTNLHTVPFTVYYTLPRHAVYARDWGASAWSLSWWVSTAGGTEVTLGGLALLDG